MGHRTTDYRTLICRDILLSIADMEDCQYISVSQWLHITLVGAAMVGATLDFAHEVV